MFCPWGDAGKAILPTMSNVAAGDDYYPLTIARSDGKGWKNLDYNPLNLDEDKDVEQKERWEVIIAGHVSQQLLPKTESMDFSTPTQAQDA